MGRLRGGTSIQAIMIVPRDLLPVRTRLAFIYTPLRHDVEAALESVGLLPHLQAALLARALRGDLDGYPPFLWK